MGLPEDEQLSFGLSNTTKSADEEELAGLIWLEKELNGKLTDLQEKKYEDKIAKEEKLVANETTAGVATMLAAMREQMHRFGAPFYEKVLKEEIASVKKKQAKLLKKINEGDDKDEEKKEKKEIVVEKEEAPVLEVEKSSKTSWWFSITLIVLAAVGMAALIFFCYRKASQA